MKSTSESLSPPETSNGRAAEDNCVVVRRGGEQSEADLRSQMKVNPIRPAVAASLLASDEACRIRSERTLGLAWEKVKSNAGACGVDGITVERFDKDSQSRLLAVKEHLERGTYQPKPVKRAWIILPAA